MGKFVLSLLAALVLAHDASAQKGPEFVSGNQLYNLCSAPGATTNDAYCQGFIIGAIDGARMVEITAGKKSIICLPDNNTQQQIKDVVVNYLRAHSEDRHYSGASLVYAALYEKFSCR
jgi:hypothetical protein